jgi:hypothetical protein
LRNGRFGGHFFFSRSVKAKSPEILDKQELSASLRTVNNSAKTPVDLLLFKHLYMICCKAIAPLQAPT